MIVTPYREDPFLRIRNFDDFFVAVQYALRERLDDQLDELFDGGTRRRGESGAVGGDGGSSQGGAIAQVSQIVSLSVPLYGVDPLLALDALAKADQDYFYWENGRRAEAIAAVGNVASVCLSGHTRMAEAKQFIRQCFEQTITIGDTDCPFAGARFFCRFTFFGHTVASPSPEHADDVMACQGEDRHTETRAERPCRRPASRSNPIRLGTMVPPPTLSPVPRDVAFAPASLILPQWQVATQGDLGSFVANLPLTSKTNLRAACAHIWSRLERVRALTERRRAEGGTGRGHRRRPIWSESGDRHTVSRNSSDPVAAALSSPASSSVSSPIPQLSQQERSQVEASVRALLDAIQTNDLSKVVLAHKLDVVLPTRLHVPAVLQTLRQVHADCYLFATQNQRGQTFLGASPERLLSIRQGYLTTEAIAGSAPRGTTSSDDARLANGLLSSLKEQHEHQLVVDFINQHLEALGLTTQRSPFPCLLQLSNIQHLQTPIYAQLIDGLHPLDIVAALHPTPAVAGVPRQQACDYIRRYESFERSLYAAPFGWIDNQGDSEFLVGIRSAQLDGKHARLYAGAGIVHGSDPAQELAEIELKLRALFSTLIQPNL